MGADSAKSVTMCYRTSAGYEFCFKVSPRAYDENQCSSGKSVPIKLGKNWKEIKIENEKTAARICGLCIRRNRIDRKTIVHRFFSKPNICCSDYVGQFRAQEGRPIDTRRPTTTDSIRARPAEAATCLKKGRTAKSASPSPNSVSAGREALSPHGAAAACGRADARRSALPGSEALGQEVSNRRRQFWRDGDSKRWEYGSDTRPSTCASLAPTPGPRGNISKVQQKHT